MPMRYREKIARRPRRRARRARGTGSAATTRTRRTASRSSRPTSRRRSSMYPEIVDRRGLEGGRCSPTATGALVGRRPRRPVRLEGRRRASRSSRRSTRGRRTRPGPSTIRAIYRSTNPAFDDKTHVLPLEVLRGDAQRVAARGVHVRGPGRRHLHDEGQGTATTPEASSRAIDAALRRRRPAHAHADRGRVPGPVRLDARQPPRASSAGSAAAILVAIFFSVLNTTGMAARERSRDVGILKALGFRDRTAARMLLLESVLLIGGGGLVGVVLGWFSVPLFRRPVRHPDPELPRAHRHGRARGRRRARDRVRGRARPGAGGCARLRTVDVLREGA